MVFLGGLLFGALAVLVYLLALACHYYQSLPEQMMADEDSRYIHFLRHHYGAQKIHVAMWLVCGFSVDAVIRHFILPGLTFTTPDSGYFGDLASFWISFIRGTIIAYVLWYIPTRIHMPWWLWMMAPPLIIFLYQPEEWLLIVFLGLSAAFVYPAIHQYGRNKHRELNR